jgi:NAD(P)-dependent dehydrogenase (short-subunit alcohol dehydrogenase family)
VIADELEGNVIELEGHDLVVVEVGHTDTDYTTCLHAPSVGLVVAGDVAYNDVHLYLAESNEQTRREWISALDTIESLNPRVVIAGHKRPGNDDNPKIIEETRQYIRDFNRVAEMTTGARALRQDARALSGSGQSGGSALAFGARGKGLIMTIRKVEIAPKRGRLARSSEQMKTKEQYMRKLEGKIALITGGNSGIGLATAKQFVNEGAYVFITGRRDPELAAAVRGIGRNVSGVQGDVSNPGDLDRLFAQIRREKGKLDIVFANAGIAKYAPFGSITEDLYDSIFDINVKGLLFTVQKSLPLLPEGASIILNASIVASKGLPANSVYSATKAAVRSFARTWTTDLKDRRIRVNAVSPGATDTPGLSGLLASTETGQQRKKMISNSVPLGRFGTPDEIAKAVVFLASDDSSYITGTELFVDGGFAQV